MPIDHLTIPVTANITDYQIGVDVCTSTSIPKNIFYMIGANGSIVMLKVNNEDEKKPRRPEDRFLALEIE
jgi:hypothetical protein